MQRWLILVDAILVVALVVASVGPSWSLVGLQFGRRSADLSSRADARVEGHPAAQNPATTPGQVSGDATGSREVGPPATGSNDGPVTDRRPGWVAAENAAAGTEAWKITERNAAGVIEGYTRMATATPGTDVALLVSTASPSFVAEVYRMGFYGGKRGRLVWTSPPTPGHRQAPAVVDPVTGLAEARWTPSLTVPIGTAWLPGMYLVKLVSSLGDQSYVPLTVRDDAARADIVVIDAVSTWQAYNQWGGCSLYECHGIKGRTRAVKVSFDRPYARSFNDGSADFLDHELPLVALVEELGIDTGYATSIDLHEHPDIATTTNAVLSLGHDEYYSAPMRQALLDALGKGVNLAFFGANAIYRHVRFEPARDGRTDRVMANYRDQPDPVTSDPTREWRLQGKPEGAIVGIQYLCAGVDAGMVVSSSGHWIWANTNVHDGQILPGMVGNESDGIDHSVSPSNLDVLAASPVTCGKRASTAATAYHTTPSGAGVFAAGTIWWVCALDAQYCSTPANTPTVRTATTNVLRVFAHAPAGRDHPSGTTPT